MSPRCSRCQKQKTEAASPIRTILDARSLVREIADTGEEQQGIKPEYLLYMPDSKFFRQRGMEEIIFLPYDVRGEMLTENGAPVSAKRDPTLE